MKTAASNAFSPVEEELSQLIVEVLNLEDIDPATLDKHAALFGDGLGLDSIDALEIGAAISKRYNIKLKSQSEETQDHFSTLHTLANFVESSLAQNSTNTEDQA